MLAPYHCESPTPLFKSQIKNFSEGYFIVISLLSFKKFVKNIYALLIPGSLPASSLSSLSTEICGERL